jgi:hypothetical protein
MSYVCRPALAPCEQWLAGQVVGADVAPSDGHGWAAATVGVVGLVVGWVVIVIVVGTFHHFVVPSFHHSS